MEQQLQIIVLCLALAGLLLDFLWIKGMFKIRKLERELKKAKQ